MIFSKIRTFAFVSVYGAALSLWRLLTPVVLLVTHHFKFFIFTRHRSKTKCGGFYKRNPFKLNDKKKLKCRYRPPTLLIIVGVFGG